MACVVPEGAVWRRGMLPADAFGGGWAALALADHAPQSQYDALLAAARAPGGIPAPVAAVALTGDGFHGNRDRPWRAVRGNLHLSCALPVDLDATAVAAAVPAIPAVAAIEAIEHCAPKARPRLKWVNDITIGGAKTAGVLAAAQSRGRRLICLVYGVGINVAVAPEVPPTVFVPSVTCLDDHGGPIDLGVLAAALITRLGAQVATLVADGPEPVVTAYRARCDDVGREVAVYAEGLPDTDRPQDLPAPLARGRVLGLDAGLALQVEGSPIPLVGGRLRHLSGQGES